jgi:hypothetical protein
MGLAGSAVLLVVLGMGCGGGDDDSSTGGKGANGHVPGQAGSPCTTGTTFSCTGRNLCQGIQLCGSDNLLGECVCNDTSSGPGTSSGDGGGASNDAAVSDAGAQPPPTMQGHDAGTQPPPPTTQGHDAGTHPPPKAVEDCSNGIDDDGDGDPDCADSDCSTWSCDGSAPTGWTGPSVVYVGSDPPNCGGDYAKQTLSGGTAVDAAAAACSSCSCTSSKDSTTNAACATLVNILSTTDPSCGGTQCTDSVTEACKTITSSCFGSATSGHISMQLPANLASCEPVAAQNPTVADATWKKEVRACSVATKLHIGGCAEGEVCAPKTPFSGDICVSKTGDVDCPNAVYSAKHVYYKGMNDTRSCSPCGCDHDCSYAWRTEAAGASCSAAFALGESDKCVAVSPSSGQINVGVQISGTGACAATGGAPTGDAVATGPVTVCCQP